MELHKVTQRTITVSRSEDAWSAFICEQMSTVDTNLRMCHISRCTPAWGPGGRMLEVRADQAEVCEWERYMSMGRMLAM